jgi:hypothetical protein
MIEHGGRVSSISLSRCFQPAANQPQPLLDLGTPTFLIRFCCLSAHISGVLINYLRMDHPVKKKIGRKFVNDKEKYTKLVKKRVNSINKKNVL